MGEEEKRKEYKVAIIQGLTHISNRVKTIPNTRDIYLAINSLSKTIKEMQLKNLPYHQNPLEYLLAL